FPLNFSKRLRYLMIRRAYGRAGRSEAPSWPFFHTPVTLRSRSTAHGENASFPVRRLPAARRVELVELALVREVVENLVQLVPALHFSNEWCGVPGLHDRPIDSLG